SIQYIELIAAVVYEKCKEDRQGSEQIEPLYRMLGSYLGEVFRRNHGAEWGWVTMHGKRIPGMASESHILFSPWARALGRVTEGPEDNLWHYYQNLLSPDTSALKR